MIERLPMPAICLDLYSHMLCCLLPHILVNTVLQKKQTTFFTISLFIFCCFNTFISLYEIMKFSHCDLSLPLAMTCGLLAGQKQRLWRVSSAWRRCCARSANSSRAPVTLRILCWPSSANETLTSSFSHRPSRQPADVALKPPTFLGIDTDGKACRKLFWEGQQRKHVNTRSEKVVLIPS